ncbi:MAG: DNA-3-methyladenine glycosylase family protein [Acidimicrobiia bacterium]
MSATGDDLWNLELKLAAAPGPVQWSHFTNHYVMAPWHVEGRQLVRPLVTPDGTPVVTISRNLGSVEVPDLRVVISSDQALESHRLDSLTLTLGDALGLNEDVTDFYDKIVPADPVLSAAADYGLRGARLRIAPSVLEALVAALASQKVHFSRTYQVMECLTRKFGRPVRYSGGVASTFPTVDVIATRSEEELASCGLGYRARLLHALAKRITGDYYGLQRLRDEPNTEAVRDSLMELPGVGPFTADLVLSIGFRRPSFHLDSYTRQILELLYGVNPDDAAMTTFVESRFGRWKHYAILLLTTDTERWSPALGIEFPIKSGASYRLPGPGTA